MAEALNDRFSAVVEKAMGSLETAHRFLYDGTETIIECLGHLLALCGSAPLRTQGVYHPTDGIGNSPIRYRLRSLVGAILRNELVLGVLHRAHFRLEFDEPAHPAHARLDLQRRHLIALPQRPQHFFLDRPHNREP